MAIPRTNHRYWAGLAAVSLIVAIFAACGGDDDTNPLSPGGADDDSTEVAGDAATAATATPDASPTPEPTTYTVQSGDTLSQIAERFGITVDALVAANELADPDSLALGDVLTIPAADDQPAETDEEDAGAS